MTTAGSPGRIAVLGASADRSKFGNKCVRAYLHAGWEVVPVNPRGGEIEGLEVATSLGVIEGELDRVSVYLPPKVSLAAIPEIAAAGAETFFNPGSANEEVLAAAEAAGVDARPECSIVAIGLSPGQFP